MPATIACPKCQTRYKIPDSAFGKPIKCKKCGAEFRTKAPQSQPGNPGAVSQKPLPSASRKAAPTAQEMAKYGIDGELKKQADIFSAPPPAPNQASPLGNFALEDPGFADVDFARQEVVAEAADDDGMHSIVNNPYAAPSIRTGPKKQKGKGERYTKPTGTQLLFSFKGRVPRRVYWGMAFGLNIGVSLLFGGLLAAAEMLDMTAVYIVAFVLMFLMYIFVVWVSLAITVKRWHDVNKSGWWLLIGFVPMIGPIWAFVENGCLRGTVGPNEYGPDPT